MLKKLQNLLFEEDDDMDDEIEESHVEKKEVQPQREVREEKPVVPQPVAQPKQEPVLKRIDVTQSIPVKPVQDVPAPSFDSLFSEPEEKKEVEKKQPKLGIVLDETVKPVSKPQQPQQAKPSKPKEKQAPKVKPGYEFKPVISPIFGVDEKDLTAVKNTTRKYAAPEKIKSDKNVSSIISPMYGKDEDDAQGMIANSVEKSEINEKIIGNVNHFKAEEDIPEFSLDDILLVRDNSSAMDDTKPSQIIFPDDDDTTVIDKRKISNLKDVK